MRRNSLLHGSMNGWVGSYLASRPPEIRRTRRLVDGRGLLLPTSAQTFLQHFGEARPIDITIILTDSSKELTDRFCRTGERRPTGNHRFGKTCQAHTIDHRLIPPDHPQTDGMAERFNQRIGKIIKRTLFKSARELADTLKQYCETYDHHLAFRGIGHRTPIEMMLDY